jgi:ribonuclease HI
MGDISNICQDLELSDCDLILIGDGSGTVADTPSAWSCWRYLVSEKILDFHFGTTSFGTNNYAELFPYLATLWLDHTEKHPLPRKVGIISDSELTVNCGSGKYARNFNLPLWAGLDYLIQTGYIIKWKHIPRNSNPWHALCDRVAGKLRKQMKEFQLTTAKDPDIMRVWNG